MAEKEIPEENIEIQGKIIGSNSTIKLSVKTAIWFLTGIVIIVMLILTYSYFKLKDEVNTQQNEFVKSVNEKVEKIQNDVTNIRISQEEMRGNIKLILDRQSRDNPIQNTGTKVYSYVPPSIPNIKQ
jgi:hypothetical protein